jgi:hypothetical protein
MLGMVSPWLALHTPLGPSKTAVPPLTSRITHPAMVVGLVSATAVGLDKSVRPTAVRGGGFATELASFAGDVRNRLRALITGSIGSDLPLSRRHRASEPPRT